MVCLLFAGVRMDCHLAKQYVQTFECRRGLRTACQAIRTPDQSERSRLKSSVDRESGRGIKQGERTIIQCDAGMCQIALMAFNARQNAREIGNDDT
jgi:hypothetical protein